MELWEYEGMNKISLRMHQVRGLRELPLPRDVLNTEALMLILSKKFKTPDGKRMLLKYLDAQDDKEVMERKTRVLSYLNHSPYKEIEELIIPEEIVLVDTQHAGFAMPLIEKHINLGGLLNDPSIDFSIKKQYLIELGNLLDKIERVKAKHKMIFADLNEYNFIIDSKNKIRAIDLDSSYIEGIDISPPDMAYYLLKNKYLTLLPQKYPSTSDGIIIPNENTDLYCYNMIVLNTIANEKIHKIDLEEFYEYLRFLEEIGFNEEILEIFKTIYKPKNNENPRLQLEKIKSEIIEKADYKVFKKEFKKN